VSQKNWATFVFIFTVTLANVDRFQ